MDINTGSTDRFIITEKQGPQDIEDRGTEDVIPEARQEERRRRWETVVEPSIRRRVSAAFYK